MDRGVSRFLLAAWLVVALSVHAQNPASATRLFAGMGDVHHPVATANPEAQRYFDQGLALIYGFNHDEAARSFRRAAELDPKMAMAWWGVALAVGPNYNLPVDPQRESEAYSAIQTALKLSTNGPKVEQAYITALANRYTNQPTSDYLKLEQSYHDAMRAVIQTYPDDLDAATLFAESGMNLRPWKLWNSDGTPAPGTEEIVATLESVLKRDPNHLGANHYYIHAVEASPHPERALASAMRLASLAPSAGHLVHMPAHIYIRTGDHAASEHTNELAAAADERYIDETKAQGIYPLMYYTHNLHFLAYENAMMGRFTEAMKGAERARANVAPHVQQMAMLDFFQTLPTVVLVRFQRWDDILRLPQPDPSLALSNGVRHYARGLAFASRGQISQAQAELAALQQLAPAMGKYPTNVVGPRNAGIIPQIAAQLIEASIAQAQKNMAGSLEHLRQAVALQDSMDYIEPPDWFYPVREALGAALLMNGDAVEAEKVFRADLEINPRNGRSLFGLMEALKAQGRNDDVIPVRQQYEVAWRGAEMQLRLSNLWIIPNVSTATEARK